VEHAPRALRPGSAGGGLDGPSALAAVGLHFGLLLGRRDERRFLDWRDLYM